MCQKQINQSFYPEYWLRQTYNKLLIKQMDRIDCINELNGPIHRQNNGFKSIESNFEQNSLVSAF